MASGSIYNSESILSTYTVDQIEDNFGFHSSIKGVCSLSSYSYLENLSPYISEIDRNTENYYLTNFYYEDKTNPFITPFSSDE